MSVNCIDFYDDVGLGKNTIMLRRSFSELISSGPFFSMAWRADKHHFDSIFRLGFVSRNEHNTSLILHVAGERSAYVSFGKSIDDSIPFMRANGFMYLTKKPEIHVDVTASVGFDDDAAVYAEKAKYENELAGAGSMAPTDIYQARQWLDVDGIPGHTFAGPVYTNPNYQFNRDWTIEILSQSPHESGVFQAELRKRGELSENQRYMLLAEAKEIAEAFRHEFKYVVVPNNTPVETVKLVPANFEGDAVVTYALRQHAEKLRLKGLHLSQTSFSMFTPKNKTEKEKAAELHKIEQDLLSPRFI
jgi:hypothetical protein